MKLLWVGGAVVILALGWQWTRKRAGVRAQVEQYLREGALVLDVRTAREYAAGHYPDAVNIPLAELPHRLKELPDRQQPLVVHCHSGARSAVAVALLHKAGYTQAVNAGGLSALPAPR